MNPFNKVKAPKSLLILAPNEFMDALEPLVTHKNQTGMPAIAISIEKIAAFFPGPDEPEKIKRAIQYAFEHLSTVYVMLVGDASKFPVRYWSLQEDHDGFCTPDCQFIQSDLYYANLYHHKLESSMMVADGFDNWDQNGDGLYSTINTNVDTLYNNPDGVDGYPDLAVGRVTARTVEDVTVYVNKIIRYESPAPALIERGVPLNFTFVFDPTYDGALDNTNSIAMNSGLEGNNATSLCFEMFNSGTVPTPPGFTNVNAMQLAAQAGISTWLSYIGLSTGFGLSTGINSWSGFDDSDVRGAENSKCLPVVFAIGTQSGSFATMAPWYPLIKFTDIVGNIRGPFIGVWQPNDVVPPSSFSVYDQTTGQEWTGTLASPVIIPKVNPLNSQDADNVQSFATSWLFTANGGGIAYFAESSPVDYRAGAELETYMLSKYASLIQPGAGAPVLGDFYLGAQRQFYASHHNDTSGAWWLVPRLYLSLMVFHGDPSLRLPVYREEIHIGKESLNYEIVLEGPDGSIEILFGDEGPPIYITHKD